MKEVDLNLLNSSGMPSGRDINDTASNQINDDICSRLDYVFDLIFSSTWQCCYYWQICVRSRWSQSLQTCSLERRYQQLRLGFRIHLSSTRFGCNRCTTWTTFCYWYHEVSISCIDTCKCNRRSRNDFVKKILWSKNFSVDSSSKCKLHHWTLTLTDILLW